MHREQMQQIQTNQLTILHFFYYLWLETQDAISAARRNVASTFQLLHVSAKVA